MKSMLLGLAAAAALALPAAAGAQGWGRQSQSAQAGVSSSGDDRHGRDGRHYRRPRGDVLYVGPVAPEGWAAYNNRTFAPDSFNDWWHDRPDRAYPRWIYNNQDCARRFWAGGAWRCSL